MLRYTGATIRFSPLHLVRAMTESTGIPSDEIADRDRFVHQFKNHLAVIVGFCDVLLKELPEDDPTRVDLVEMHKAALAAVALLPDLSARMR